MNKLILIASIIVVGGLVTVNYIPNSDTNTEEYVVAESDILSPHVLIEAIEKSELSEAEIDGLLRMREEEKLAHDVYTTLYDKWGVKIFSNIAKSEQTHTDTIAYLLDRYEIEDPVKSGDIGVFTNSEMDELYNSLVELGSRSAVEAMLTGAIIEDLDIKDLQELSEETDNEDILIAYGNLTRGSRNHLRAFAKQLAKYGEEYPAQFLTQPEVDEILSGSQEMGLRLK